MGYTHTLPADQEIKDRIKAIVKLIKFQRNLPKLSQIDAINIMTEEYLMILRNRE